MKAILILLAALTISASAQYRTWTQEATGRTIRAKITDKADDHSKAKVVTINGKVFWLKSSDLSQADQEFILEWAPKIDHLSARVVKSGKGAKEIRVTAQAQARELVLTVIHDNGDPDSVVYIGKDETIDKTFTVGSRYEVELHDDETGALIDAEKWNKKTGL
jgi:hypothetical protein